MKKTPLNHIHHSLGAKMVPFAGYEMPISYSGVKNEHNYVRNYGGVFDVSHMGEFIVEGKNAAPFLQKICSNDIDKIKLGKAQYNCFPNEKGGIVDDLIVYKIEHNKFLLVVNASNIEKDWKWVTKYNKPYKNKISNISNETSLIAIQGPKTMEIIKEFIIDDISLLKNYSHITSTFCGIENVLISTTGYTGSGGVEIYCKNHDAVKIWETIFNSKKNSLIPVGLAARDTLRIEMGYCLYGNEINDSTSPIMAGLSWITKPYTGCISSKKFEKEIKEGARQNLVGIIMTEKGIPRSGYLLTNRDNIKIGQITSGTFSPKLNKGIAIAYIDLKYNNYENEIFIDIRNKKFKVNLVKLPFIKN